jgi:Molecular chaperone (small heat shock protein)
MPTEPKSFFERLTGARMLGRSGSQQRIQHDDDEEKEFRVSPSTAEVEDVADEVEVDQEESFSDEVPTSAGGSEVEQEGQLTVDVFQDDANIIVQSTIAGVSPEDLDVSITNDMVTIRGERRRMYSVDPDDYFYQECYWGTFSRSIVLPVEIDADRAEAKIKNGILTIRIPKANTAVTRKLKVTST